MNTAQKENPFSPKILSLDIKTPDVDLLGCRPEHPAFSQYIEKLNWKGL